MTPLVDARVFQTYEQKTYWGVIEEVTDKKIVIKWDALGNLGQTSTTFHGDLSALIRNKDCWEVKF